MDFEPDNVDVPPLDLPDSTRRDFATLWERHREGSNGRIDYDLAAPKSLFLRWLTEVEGYLLHGTSDDSIDVFEPREQTDVAQRSVRGVFAASDGIWPMYFALLNRSGRAGSLRNGCTRLSDGSRRYYFSVNAAWLDAEPWSDGTVYVLPAEGFRRCIDADGTSTQEWLNESPVVPIARIRITPADFPFLDRVTGHDDSDIFRFFEAFEHAVQHAAAATPVDDGWLLEFTPAPERVDELTELCRLVWRSIVFADLVVTLECQSSEGPVRLTLSGSSVVNAAVAAWRANADVGVP